MLWSKLQLAESQRPANAQAASILHRADRAACDERVKCMETLWCRCSRGQQKQWWLHDPCVPLTAAKQRAGSRSSLRQGSSSPPLRMTSFKCFLPTQAFATPYSSVTSRGHGGISKGAGGAFKLRRDLGKPRAMPSSVARCSETESWIKGMPRGEGEGWGHKEKSSPAESPLCLLHSCWDVSEVGWRPVRRGPANTHHPSYV